MPKHQLILTLEQTFSNLHHMQCFGDRRTDGFKNQRRKIELYTFLALIFMLYTSKTPGSPQETTIPENNQHHHSFNKFLGLCDQSKSTSDSTGDHDCSATIVQLAPLQLQLSELGLSSLLSAILVGAIGNTSLEDLCQFGHSLVHWDLDQQCPSCGCDIQTKSSSELGELGLGDQVTVAGAQECGAGEDEVGERAQGVEGREEVLAIVEEVGGLLGCVVDWYADDVVGQSGHDQRRLQH
jgi:hypothetical protein